MSCLDMQLMFKQLEKNTSELNQWLDMVAKASIKVFQLHKCVIPFYSSVDRLFHLFILIFVFIDNSGVNQRQKLSRFG